MKQVLILLGLSLLLLGCLGQNTSSSNQGLTVLGSQDDNSLMSTGDEPLIVGVGDMVKVDYNGTFEDGNVFDSSEGREPLQFMTGAGQMIPGFEEAVMGMKLNEEKHVVLPPEEAYGYPEDYAPYTDELPIVVLQSNGVEDINVGMELYAPGATAIVRDINRDGGYVTLDVTPIVPELAGKTLIFDIKVVEILKQGVVNQANTS